MLSIFDSIILTFNHTSILFEMSNIFDFHQLWAFFNKEVVIKNKVHNSNKKTLLEISKSVFHFHKRKIKIIISAPPLYPKSSLSNSTNTSHFQSQQYPTAFFHSIESYEFVDLKY